VWHSPVGQNLVDKKPLDASLAYGTQGRPRTASTSMCDNFDGYAVVPAPVERQARTLKVSVLTLRELETLAGLLLAVLLAFNHAGVARKKTCGTQNRAKLAVIFHKCPRYA
jgi:hypothetical protein